MHFDREDIKQFTPEYFANLSPLSLVEVTSKITQDLTELLDKHKNDPRLQSLYRSGDSLHTDEKRGCEKNPQETFSVPPQNSK